MGVIPQDIFEFAKEVLQMEAITTGMTTITGFMGNVFDLMTSNAYLATFMASGFILLGVKVFRWVKRAASR